MLYIRLNGTNQIIGDKIEALGLIETKNNEYKIKDANNTIKSLEMININPKIRLPRRKSA